MMTTLLPHLYTYEHNMSTLLHMTYTFITSECEHKQKSEEVKHGKGGAHSGTVLRCLVHYCKVTEMKVHDLNLTKKWS